MEHNGKGGGQTNNHHHHQDILQRMSSTKQEEGTTHNRKTGGPPLEEFMMQVKEIGIKRQTGSGNITNCNIKRVANKGVNHVSNENMAGAIITICTPLQSTIAGETLSRGRP